MPYIKVHSEIDKVRLIPLDKPKLIFGRDQACEIVLRNPAVSRQHIRITCVGERYFVEDRAAGAERI